MLGSRLVRQRRRRAHRTRRRLRPVRPPLPPRPQRLPRRSLAFGVSPTQLVPRRSLRGCPFGLVLGSCHCRDLGPKRVVTRKGNGRVELTLRGRRPGRRVDSGYARGWPSFTGPLDERRTARYLLHFTPSMVCADPAVPYAQTPLHVFGTGHEHGGGLVAVLGVALHGVAVVDESGPAAPWGEVVPRHLPHGGRTVFQDDHHRDRAEAGSSEAFRREKPELRWVLRAPFHHDMLPCTMYRVELVNHGHDVLDLGAATTETSLPSKLLPHGFASISAVEFPSALRLVNHEHDPADLGRVVNLELGGPSCFGAW